MIRKNTARMLRVVVRSNTIGREVAAVGALSNTITNPASRAPRFWNRLTPRNFAECRYLAAFPGILYIVRIHYQPQAK